MTPGLSDLPIEDLLRTRIADARHAEEAKAVAALLEAVQLPAAQVAGTSARARRIIEGVRAGGPRQPLDAFLLEYDLSSQEGVALMCLAEALLRIPDAETANRIIRDKIGDGDWASHLDAESSLLVNASTWGLMLTGRVVGFEPAEQAAPWTLVRALVGRVGAPIIRAAVTRAMDILGAGFVLGHTIDEALDASKSDGLAGDLFSFDMLGEAARTAADASRYLAAYETAIDTTGAIVNGRSVMEAPGVSVKLSALHPRYEESQRERVYQELLPRLSGLAHRARAVGIGMCIDAEESQRLDLSLDLVEALLRDPSLHDWPGLGFAVQAYQKTALPVLDWLYDRVGQNSRTMTVRLVKGAYWDTEIKRAQELGVQSYPVFTRKRSTDVSYIACTQKLMAMRDRIFPQFATHNAHTIAAVIELAGGSAGYEFQRLHGMGEAPYRQLKEASEALQVSVRVYAPVGSHQHLLSYLVRRLLENGANTSFVNRLQDATVPVSEMVVDPVARTAATDPIPHPRIPLPANMYLPVRHNSAGVDLADRWSMAPILDSISEWTSKGWDFTSTDDPNPSELHNPANLKNLVGTYTESTAFDVGIALDEAHVAGRLWDGIGGGERAACLLRAADLLEACRSEFIALLVSEAGKTVGDGIAEVREAVDFCRYYADRARADFSGPTDLPGPTGERNQIALHGRGTFACISPWNFPLAIFIGQVAAALAAGNAVVAKPAEQTPLVALRAVDLLRDAGVPPEAVHVVTGNGATIGSALVQDLRVSGVAFTGSTETALAINRALATRPGPIVPLIAETGGQNAMIVDSSALPEQVTADVLASAFGGAGQRCSCLRVLFLQADVADTMLDMIVGAMAELRIGRPEDLATDVGPVIDVVARSDLETHLARMKKIAAAWWSLPLPSACGSGSFVAPHIFEIDHICRLEREVFGPILHVVRFPRDGLDQVLDDINETGYGLTLGVHSRIDTTVDYIRARLAVGNIYVNRAMTGAVVGAQPFGGEGLSGTGPKVGGPRSLHRYATERTLTINTAAAGGNATLIADLGRPS